MENKSSIILLSLILTSGSIFSFSPANNNIEKKYKPIKNKLNYIAAKLDDISAMFLELKKEKNWNRFSPYLQERSNSDKLLAEKIKNCVLKLEKITEYTNNFVVVVKNEVKDDASKKYFKNKALEKIILDQKELIKEITDKANDALTAKRLSGNNINKDKLNEIDQVKSMEKAITDIKNSIEAIK